MVLFEVVGELQRESLHLLCAITLAAPFIFWIWSDSSEAKTQTALMKSSRARGCSRTMFVHEVSVGHVIS